MLKQIKKFGGDASLTQSPQATGEQQKRSQGSNSRGKDVEKTAIKSETSPDTQSVPSESPPFARVESVATGSPAAAAGL